MKNHQRSWKYRAFIGCMSLWLVGNPLFAQSAVGNPVDPRSVLEQIQGRFDLGAYPLAQRGYDQFVVDHRSSALVDQARYFGALASFRMGEYDDALKRFDLHISLHPQSSLAQLSHYHRAMSLYQLGQSDESRPALEQLQAQLGPESPLAPLQRETLASVLATLYEDAGNYSQAQGQLLAIAQGDGPDDRRSEALKKALSFALDGFGEAEALAVAETALDQGLLAADDRPAALLVAELYHRQGQRDQAEEKYQLARRGADGVAAAALARLFEYALADGDEDSVDQLVRDAELRLTAVPQVLVQFWLRAGQARIAEGKDDLGEYFLTKAWDFRDIVQLPDAVPLYLARLHWSRSREDLAISVLEETQELSYIPSSAVSRLQLLQYYAHGDRWEDLAREAALTSADEQLKENENLYRYLAASANFRLGELDRAYSYLSDYNPPSGELLLTTLELRGRIELGLGLNQKATVSFSSYLQRNGDNGALWREYGRLLINQGAHSRFLRESSAFITRIDDWVARGEGAAAADALRLRAIAAHNQGQYPRAQEAFETAAAIDDPQEDPILANLSRYYLALSLDQLDSGRAALGAYEAYVDGPDPLADSDEGARRHQARYLGAWVANREGELERGVALLSDFGSSRGSGRYLVSGLYLRSAMEAGLGLYAQAVSSVDTLIELAPQSPLAPRALADSAEYLYSSGQLDGAIARLEQLYSQERDREYGPDALFRIGQMYLESERFEEARDAFIDFRSAYPRASGGDVALYNQASASLGLNETAGALLYWQQLVSQYPRSNYAPLALDKMSRTYFATGDYRQSFNMLTRLLSEYPLDAETYEADRRSKTLTLIIGGVPPEEAEYWVEIETSGGIATAQGREAILRLGRLIFQSDDSQFTNVSITTAVYNLESLYQQIDAYPPAAAEAAYLLGLNAVSVGEYQKASGLFLEAASAAGSNRDLVGESLLAAMESLIALGQDDQARAVATRIDELLAGTSYQTRAGELLGGL